MKITSFNAKKTLSKYPASPYGDDTFLFETKRVNSIKEIFDNITSNFTLNMPLNKVSVIELRRSGVLKEYFIPKLEYIIVDIDKIKTSSDRELALKWFRESEYEVILGESRSLYNLKGVLKVQPMTQKQGKAVLKEIGECIPGVMDPSSLNYASYQAPILKNNVLLEKGGNPYPIPDIIILPQLTVKVPNSIEQLCIDEFVLQGFSFDKVIDNGYQCSHPSEVKSKGGFNWSRNRPFTMGHWNSERNASAWEAVIKTEEYRNYKKEISKQEVKDIMPKLSPTTNKRYLDNSSEVVQDFIDNHNILKIQSPMGTGKSAIIEEVIHQARKNSLRVLFLTNRISLADDIENKYDGIKHYLGTEIEGNKYNFGDDLVVQIDSLHKFSTKYFDVCIMDEAATTMMHLLTLENHQKSITSKIFSLRKKKLVLADAFLFDDMVDVFRYKGSVVEIINGYRDSLDLDFYSQKDKFIYDLIEEAKTAPITFSSGSTMMLKIVKVIAEQNHLSTITISGDTPKEERKLIYKSMESCTPKWDILMYSPSITVGISNENQIDTHYHFDSGLSMNTLSSIQMTKRTRKAQRIRLYIAERIQYNPIDIIRIQTELSDFKAHDEDGDSIGISLAGENLSKIISLSNTMENRHKVAFLELMKYQFNMLGHINQVQDKVKPFLARFSKFVKAEETKNTLDLFEEYKSMSDEALSDIEYKLFATNKDEEKIKLFMEYKKDETLKLSDDNLNILIQGEIEYPGTIEAYKHNLKNPLVAKSSSKNNYILSINDMNIFRKKGINIKDFGFIKSKNRYVLNKTIHELLN